MLKRVIDIVLSASALVLLSPLLAAVALAVRLASPGPAMFSQPRVGEHERLFRLYKFRTMRVSQSGPPGSLTTIAGDPRVFPVGAWLRRTKIDELPQLYNVLRGEMSLVGPRPTVAEDHARMTPAQRGRVAVRPGLTGLAQLRGGAALPWPRRIELDLHYIETQTLWLDMRLMAETVWQLAAGRANEMPTTHDEWREAA